jgi:type I restriction enzyme S subunit
MDNEKEFKDLPEGWKWVRLEEVGENKKFSIVDGPFGTQLHADEYIEDGEIPVVRVINLSFEGKFIEKDLVFISQQKAKKLSRSKVVTGDIIIAKTGATIGKCGIFPNSFLEGIIASSCMKVSIDKTKANNLFLLFWLVSRHGQNAIINSALGTTRTTINITPFKNLKIPLPPLPEQQKIAEILETIDNAIEKTDKIIEKYKRIKQGLMQDLLTKGIDENGNIRNEKTHKFKDSPLGRIPEEWEVVRLGEVSNKIIDGTHFTPQYSEDGIPFLRVVDLQGSTVNLDNVMRISPQEHRILSKRCFPEYGDILLSKNGTIGISKVVDWKWEFSIFVSICLIKPKHEKVINIYLKYFLDSEWIKKQIVKSTKQLSVVNLHLEEIREFFILLPPLPEQQRIAEILSQTDQTIEKEQQYKEKLQKIKQGLMQDLLTGKVRVNKLLEAENNEQRYTNNFTRT